MHFVGNIFTSIESKLDGAVYELFQHIMGSAFSDFAHAFLVIYIMIVSYLVIKGLSGSKTKEMAMSLILLPALWSFVFNVDTYFDWFVDPFIDTSMNLAGFIIAKIPPEDNMAALDGVKGIFKSLDGLSDEFFRFMFEIEYPGGVRNLGPFFKSFSLAMVLLVLYSAAYGAFVVIMTIGIFSMYVLFTVGGVCIFTAVFSSTRKIFYSWLRGLFHYALIIVFASIVMALCYFGLYQAIHKLMQLKGTASLYSPAYVETLCWAVLSLAMQMKAPEYASQLSGAQAGNTGALAGGIGMVAGAGASVMGLNAMKGGGRTGLENRGAIQAVGSGAGKVGSKLQDGAAWLYDKAKGLKS